MSETVTGCIVSFVAVMIVLEKSTVFSGLRFSLTTPFSLIAYLVVFLKALIVANLDMARRVLSPSLPIAPGMVSVKTSLQSDLGKLILANSITLTPGTLSVDVTGDQILVHWIDCPVDIDTESATRAIAADFEKHLKGFLK